MKENRFNSISKDCTSFHICKQMPENEFIEIQQTYWYIHRADKKHGEYRKDLKDSICPYCKKCLK